VSETGTGPVRQPENDYPRCAPHGGTPRPALPTDIPALIERLERHCKQRLEGRPLDRQLHDEDQLSCLFCAAAAALTEAAVEAAAQLRDAAQYAIDNGWSSCSHYSGCLPGGACQKPPDKWCGHCRVLNALAAARTEEGT